MSANEIIGLMIRRHGFTPTRRALTCLVSAAVVVGKTGEVPTVHSVMDFWNQSERTTYREFAAWRTVTGDGDLYAAARAVVEAYRGELDPIQSSKGMFEVAGFIPSVA